MVLDTAALDDAPPSDFDPYVSNSSSSSQAPSSPNALHIDLSQASRPFPILGPLTGFNTKHLVQLTSSIAREAPRVLQRPLTQDEIDGTVASVSKYMQVHSWIYCNALIIGGFRAHATRADMTFPGQKWLQNKNITMSINFDKFGPLRGTVSRAAWNAVRTTLWMAWWGLPAYIVGGVVGQMAMAQTQLSDERLKGFHRDMQSEGARKRVGDAVRRRQSGLPQEQPVQQQEEGQAFGDDMSPQFESESILARSENVRGGVDDFVRSTPQEPVLQSAAGAGHKDDGRFRYRTQPEASSPSAAEQTSSTSGTSSSAWDRVRNSAGQRESAWDRVRRQDTSSGEQSNTSSWQSRASNGSNNVPLTDNFTFDERDEGRQLAKAEAQKEFNARIERERQGKDFTDTKGGRMW